MTTRREAVDALARVYAGFKKQTYRSRGLLGSPGSTTVSVSGRTGMVFFREDGSSNKVIQVYNNRVPEYYNLPVVVGYDDVNPETMQVLDIDIEALADWRGRTFLQKHHKTHEYGSTDAYGVRLDDDVVYIQGRQIIPLSIRPTDTASMKVYINPGWYEFGDDRYYFPGGYSKTFVAPSVGMAVLEVIYAEAVTNIINYARGEEFPISMIAGYVDYIPSAPPSTTIVGCVVLTSSTTSITQREIADIRAFNVIHGGTTSFSNGINITGNVVVTGGSLTTHDTYVDLSGLSRLRIPRGVVVSGWEGQEAEIAWDTGFDKLYMHDGIQFVPIN